MAKLRTAAISSFALTALVALSACGEKKPEEVVSEAKKAMSELKGSEVETELKLELEDDSYQEAEVSTFEAKTKEKRSHDPLLMHREMTLYENGEEIDPGEQYVDEEGEMYALVHDNWMVGSWNIKDDDPMFSLTGSYVNGDYIIDLFDDALDELKEDEIGYEYKDGQHILTLASVHEKFEFDLKDPEAELPFIAMGGVERIEEYDVIAKVNGKTSLLEEVHIQFDYESKDNYKQQVSATLDATFTEAKEEVVIAIPEEVQTAKDNMSDTLLSLSKEAISSAEGLSIDTDFTGKTDISGSEETSGMDMGFNSNGSATEERAPYSKMMQRELEVETGGQSFTMEQYITENGNVYALDGKENKWMRLAELGDGPDSPIISREAVYIDEELILDLLLQVADDVEYDDYGSNNYGLSLYDPHTLSTEMGEAFQRVVDPGAEVTASNLSVSVNKNTFLPESVRISVDWTGKTEGMDYSARMNASSYISVLDKEVQVNIPPELLEAEGSDL